MNATVLVVHHFCHGVTLKIVDGKLFWEIDEEEQREKYGFGPAVDIPGLRFGKNPLHFENKKIDPTRVDDFVGLLDVIFEFTGCTFIDDRDGNQIDLMRIVSDQEPKPTSEEVLKVIYETPLEHEITWVRPVWCNVRESKNSLDMSRCQDPQRFVLSGEAMPKTYGDVMSYFVQRISSPRILHNGQRYYEYPDYLFSSIKRICPPKDGEILRDICPHGKAWNPELGDQDKLFLYQTCDR